LAPQWKQRAAIAGANFGRVNMPGQFFGCTSREAKLRLARFFEPAYVTLGVSCEE